ncbi:hypothetical protein [Alicyclobacillus dauci]|uniref:Uncharacterized protein n=1 Tax=Alicyclobacillus dauci TaxID=1475485 RepID=A0ABY6Z7G8_9BACL|nr:hypothetical protein [Alicyclobacillus dauci]WAH38832.1 hypothetical protein NZD86_10310 [Alicyclobacillus dauci]
MADAKTHPVWGPGLQALRRSQYAQQVLASIVHEWTVIDGLSAFVKQSNLLTLVDASSAYRTEAVGDCIRLHFIPPAEDEEHRRIIGRLLSSTAKARKADKLSELVLADMRTVESIDKSWAEIATMWHEQRCYWLKAAALSVRQAVPESVWTGSGSQS